MSDFHQRLLERAEVMGARDVRVIHRGRRPHLTGVVAGVHFVLGLHTRPKDIPENFFNALRDLRRTIASIRRRTKTGA